MKFAIPVPVAIHLFSTGTGTPYTGTTKKMWVKLCTIISNFKMTLKIKKDGATILRGLEMRIKLDRVREQQYPSCFSEAIK
jgi:hypothetical protein